MKPWLKKVLLKAAEKAAPFLPGFAKRWAKKMDGKKTVTGLAITAVGVGCLYVPGLQVVAKDLIWLGASTTAGGLAHKWQKYKKRKKSNQPEPKQPKNEE